MVLVDGTGGGGFAVHGVALPGGVVADFLGDEFFPVLGLSVDVVVVFVDVAFGDEVVALLEPLAGEFGGLAVLDEVVEGGLELGE